MGTNCNHPTCQGPCRRAVKEKKTYTIARTPIAKKPYKIKARSKKGKADDIVYAMLRKPFLAKNPVCQIKAPGCTCEATVVHHTKGRVLFFLKVATWMASCFECNLYVESHDAWAREKGFLQSKFEE